MKKRGRPKLTKNKRRKLISVRLAPETIEWLKTRPLSVSRSIDALVRLQKI